MKTSSGEQPRCVLRLMQQLFDFVFFSQNLITFLGTFTKVTYLCDYCHYMCADRNFLQIKKKHSLTLWECYWSQYIKTTPVKLNFFSPTRAVCFSFNDGHQRKFLQGYLHCNPCRLGVLLSDSCLCRCQSRDRHTER